MTAALTYENFATNLNTMFRIYVSEHQTIEAVLSEVSEHLLSPGQERFSLVFRAPNQPFLPQGMHRFEHDQIGSFDLFIVPIGRDDQRTQYEAVFNRLRPQTAR
jgi:uncharacterized protein DUF6916